MKKKFRILLALFLFAVPAFASSDYKMDAEPVVSKRQVFPNEQIILEHRIYAQVDGRIEGFDVEPRLPYFWVEDVPLPKNENLPLQMTFWRGEKAAMVMFRKTALFGMQPGHYALHPGILKGVAKNANKVMSPVFIKTQPIQIEVMEFPKAGKPDDFNGLTGTFSVASEIEILQNPEGKEYISLNIAISGEGNIRQIPLPEIKLPQGLILAEVLDDAVIDIRNQQISGTKKFRLKIMAEKTGAFKIPSVHFSYFNQYTQQYLTATSQEHEVILSSAAVYEKKEITSPQLVIALDNSGSTAALDLKPDRLEFSKKFLLTILNDSQMKNIPTSLFAFAKHVMPVWTPETGRDYDALLKAVVVTANLKMDGTAIGTVLYEAEKVFGADGGANQERYILLLTDGKHNAGYIDPLTSAYLIREKNVKVFAVGIGKNGMVDFPVPNSATGKKITKVDIGFDAETLRQIAEITGGKFYVLDSEESFKAISQELAGIFSGK